MVDAGDHFIAFDPNDRVIGRQIRVARNWERQAFDAVAALVKSRSDIRGKTFLDIGANIGTQTVYALLAGFAKAVAVEPVPANLRCLRMSAMLNDFSDRITILEQVVGAAHGQLELSLDAINSGGHSLAMEKPADSKKLTVTVDRIDDIIARLGLEPRDIGLLWVDVEGYEPQAIAGGTRLIEARTPLALEFTPQAYGPGAAAALIDLLASRYREWAITGKAGIALRPTSELSLAALPNEQVDLLFL